MPPCVAKQPQVTPLIRHNVLARTLSPAVATATAATAYTPAPPPYLLHHARIAVVAPQTCVFLHLDDDAEARIIFGADFDNSPRIVRTASGLDVIGTPTPACGAFSPPAN